MSLPIISVTGTKGKTTIARGLDNILEGYANHILRVDTEGAWLDQKLKLSHQDSKEIWGLAPGNAPGRFIAFLAALSGSKLAILECNLFCSKACGLGYSTHKVGIFTNVYTDHVGADKKLQSRGDIARAKSFIFSRIGNNGSAVYNADDKQVMSQLERLPKSKSVTRIACSLQGEPADKGADINIFIKDGALIYKTKGKENPAGKISTFNLYTPGFPQSGMNIMLMLGALIGYFEGRLPDKILEKLRSYEPAEEDGRLVLFKNKKGVKIIFDYAHEQESLKAVSRYARNLEPKGKVIGALRLPPTRTDELIKDTAADIYNCFDKFIIYDKIDGVTRRPSTSASAFKEEKTGRVSELFAKALQASGAAGVERIIEETKAVKRAFELAKRGDVIIHIQGNSAKESLRILKQSAGSGLARIKA